MVESLFVKARNLIRSNRHDHPWLEVDNMQLLRDALLHREKKYENNRKWFSLAAAQIFCNDLTIQNLLSAN